MANMDGTFEKSVGELLAELPPRSRSVVKRRYGIGGGSSLTLEAIGRKEGITRERVRQIENDALGRLKKSPRFASLKPYELFVAETINRHGGLITETTLVVLPEFSSVKDKKNLLFFFDLCDSLIRRKPDDHFRARWHTTTAPVSKIESAVRALADELKDKASTLLEKGLYSRLEAQLVKAGLGNADSRVLESYVGLARDIEKNVWGEYGHIESPFVRPRGMRESAFVALARAGNPLHFRDIAKRIGEFSSYPVHVQTVHNELIKDDRFVLVGRGLYALREWGYEPGFIKDVLVRILGTLGALTKEQILEEVSKHRQVKPSTVFINLQNRKLFKPLDNGTYTLIS